jgi:hypothetical protein
MLRSAGLSACGIPQQGEISLVRAWNSGEVRGVVVFGPLVAGMGTVPGGVQAPPRSAPASSCADPSREPLSTTTTSSSGQLTIVRSDHSRNAVSSRLLYDTVSAATLPRLAPGPVGHHTASLATCEACHTASRQDQRITARRGVPERG